MTDRRDSIRELAALAADQVGRIAMETTRPGGADPHWLAEQAGLARDHLDTLRRWAEEPRQGARLMMHFQYVTELARKRGGTPLPDSKPFADPIRYDLRLEFDDEPSADWLMSQVWESVEFAGIYTLDPKPRVQVICHQHAMPEPTAETARKG